MKRSLLLELSQFLVFSTVIMVLTQTRTLTLH